VLTAEDHLTELLLADNPHLTALLTSRRLAPLEDLTPRAQARMRATALAYVRHHGNAVAMATELKIHPQTARYRIARLKELFDEDLNDPNARLELELALRATT
jgi:DNA-binding PucR family transcriptional regulator